MWLTSLRHISPSPSPPSPPRDSSPSSPSGGGLTVSGRCLAGRHFPCLAILSESCPVKLARHHLLLSCLFPANPGILKLTAGDSVNPKCFVSSHGDKSIGPRSTVSEPITENSQTPPTETFLLRLPSTCPPAPSHNKH